MHINGLLFSCITVAIFYWGYLVFKYSTYKSVYFLYFFLNLTIFYGPLLYYKVGFDVYSNTFSEESLNEYSLLSLSMVVINIIVYSIVFKLKKYLLLFFFNTIQYSQILNKKLVGQFYWGVIIVTLFYLVIFYKYFPLAVLFDSGVIGIRPDTSGEIPLYITFAAFSMILVPTAFFYISNHINNRLIKSLLLIFTILCLSAGGNKGIVSFFLIFYSIFQLKGDGLIKWNSLMKYSILFSMLMLIYGVLKGITSLDKESIVYLMESPFRRLFVAQGSGYIARIEMMNNDLFHEGLIMKKEVYSHIYSGSYGAGASPTHFTGDILVRYGYGIMIPIYLLFSIVFTRLLVTIDLINDNKNSNNVFLLWVFFYAAFLFCNAELSLATGIRIFFIMINFVVLKFASRVQLN